jgi:L-lactate utilization protein LutC
MNFFKKLFKNYKDSQLDKEIKAQPVHLSLDDSFVHNFINKGGKFLYCTKIDEVAKHLNHILLENDWKNIVCSDIDLLKVIEKTNAVALKKFSNSIPFFTTCEHLIASNGDILFSSHQLGSRKLSEFSQNFIVYATTSQLVKNIGEGLTGIKTHFSGNIPTNISAIKNYSAKKDEDSFLDYGNSNSKNLYLLLFEDL